MSRKLVNGYYSRVTYVTFIIIPLSLSAFTHLWNPSGFPTIYVDESHYLRRALQVLEGQGPQESLEVYEHPYDHPYFGQIYLAGLFALINYPASLNLPELETIHSIQTLYFIPRLIMGLLAVIDTFFVFKIGEIRYGRKVGFIASLLFAVMPITWMFRMILLDTLLVTFLLVSIFLAMCYRKQNRHSDLHRPSLATAANRINKLYLLGSGIFLGLAIFTKVPIITMIPLAAYLVYTNTKSPRYILIWVIPVILIPLIWPSYAFITGNFENWKEGILYQVERGERDFASSIDFLYQADPILLVLGLLGVIFATVLKKDLIFLLWILPYVLTIYSVGGIIKYFHFIEIMPALALAAAILIVTLSNWLSRFLRWSEHDRLPQSLPYFVIAGIGIFGLISTGMLVTAELNRSFFEISAFVSNSISQAGSDNKNTTVMGQHWVRSFTWIPMFIHDKDLYVKDVFPDRYLREPLRTGDVLMIVDSQLKHDVLDESLGGIHLDEIRKTYSYSDRIALFLDNPVNRYNTSQYPFTNMKESSGMGLLEVRSNFNDHNIAYAQLSDSKISDSKSINLPRPKMPELRDQKLKVELVASGLKFPTTMAFVGNNDILVLEKNNGTIKRIVNGNLLDRPVLDLNVANKVERGLLGIAVANQTQGHGPVNKTLLYLFYTQSTEDGNDICPGATSCDEKTNPLGSRVYRYEWNGKDLVNMSLILDLPVGPGADHNGGVLKVGPDSNIYVLVGDGDSCWEAWCEGPFKSSTVNSKSSNVATGASPDGRGGILRITPNGEPVLGEENDTAGVIADHSPLNKYYAYGIRNGFGLAFDPVTNKLWDTENGPGYGDEINLVEPGFNSGWLRVQGWWPVTTSNPLPAARGYFDNNQVTNPANLETFADKGEYSSPEFAWNMSVGVTSLEFLKEDVLGEEHQYDMFVADYNNDYLYKFELNESRTGLELEGDLKDGIANNNEELENVVFGEGFGVITDIKEGPDGYLYLVSHINGNIYRIVPNLPA
jgi:glucose/arabinose dehydrogenase